ncbi:MAG: hypothetical protein AAF719_08120 [Pseudomonadota bacterium]
MQRPVKHVTRKGYIEYRIDSPSFPDGHWGFEDFTLTRHSDGARTLRAHCELWDEDVLIRDVVQSVDKDFTPHDFYARLTKSDAFYGAALYRFTDDEVILEGFNKEDGVISDKRPFGPHMRGFGTHALNADGWMAAKFDRSQGPRQHTFENNLLTSIDHRGATGPAFATTSASTMKYFGEETVHVKAGAFDCYHFAFVLTSNDHPPYHFWVTADGDFMFVKGSVDAPYNWTFELIDLKEWGPLGG